MSRAEALVKGLNKYFTGELCKNGHLTYRYTKSATCQECVNGDRSNMQIDPEKKLALQNLLLTKVRVHDYDYLEMMGNIWAFAAMRYPCLTVTDMAPIKKTATDRGGSTALYNFYVHPDDVREIHKVAGIMLSRNFDPIAARTAILGEAVEKVKIADTKWTPVP